MHTYPEPGYYSFYYSPSKYKTLNKTRTIHFLPFSWLILVPNIHLLRLYPGNSTQNGDYKAVVDALNFINNKPIEPFIIMLEGQGGHPPYSAPYDYYSRFTADQVKSVKKLKQPYENFCKLGHIFV